jgi:hypothetical protein
MTKYTKNKKPKLIKMKPKKNNKKVIGSNVKPKPMLESVGRQRPYSNKKIY